MVRSRGAKSQKRGAGPPLAPALLWLIDSIMQSQGSSAYIPTGTAAYVLTYDHTC